MMLASTLFTIFVVLKLVGVITWSWWWIIAPVFAVHLAVWLISVTFFFISAMSLIATKIYKNFKGVK